MRFLFINPPGMCLIISGVGHYGGSKTYFQDIFSSDISRQTGLTQPGLCCSIYSLISSLTVVTSGIINGKNNIFVLNNTFVFFLFD